jgi:hypothetical protein
MLYLAAFETVPRKWFPLLGKTAINPFEILTGKG